jgi:hypothetical protein
LLGHRLPRPDASGERRRPDAAVGQHVGHGVLIDEQGLELVVGEAGVVQQLLDGEGAGGHIGGVLQQHRVARHEGRRPEAKELPERKIPRHHRQDRAEGLVGHVARLGVGLDGLVRQEVGPVLRVVAADPGALLGLRLRLVHRLAHLAGHERAVPIGPLLQQVGRPLEAPGPLRERPVAVRLEAGDGPVQSRVELVGRMCGILFNGVAAGGVDGRKGHGTRGTFGRGGAWTACTTALGR